MATKAKAKTKAQSTPKSKELQVIKPGGLAFGADSLGAPRVLHWNGHDIHVDADGFVEVTAMWRANGSPENREFFQWSRKEGAKFVAHMTKVLNLPDGQVWKSKRGRYGGTYAHKQLAIAYAQTLSPAFQEYVIKAFLEWAEEKADPGLKMDRSVAAMKAKGWSDERILARVKGIAEGRKPLCSIMADHGCKPTPKDNPFADVSTPTMLWATGDTPKEFKAKHNLPKSASPRDHIEDPIGLTAIQLLEQVGAANIQAKAAYGNRQCVEAFMEAIEPLKQPLATVRAILSKPGRPVTA